MQVCWQENVCRIYDDAGAMRLSIEEVLSPGTLLLRMKGSVCAQTENYFIEELRAGTSIRRKVVLDLTGVEELSENASVEICAAWRQLLTKDAANLQIIGMPTQLLRRSAADTLVLLCARCHEKGEQSNA